MKKIKKFLKVAYLNQNHKFLFALETCHHHKEIKLILMKMIVINFLRASLIHVDAKLMVNHTVISIKKIVGMKNSIVFRKIGSLTKNAKTVR